MEPLRVGLIGCGAVAEWHIQSGYQTLPESTRIVATCDPRLERATALAVPLGATPYDDLDRLLADPAVEAVDLCTPHPLHAPQALRALAAGKHVLVEKPLATTVADGVAMVRAAAERGLTLCVSENYPFSEPFRRARALIDAGEIGRVVALRSHRVGYLAGIWLRDGWRQDARQAGGGMLLDQGCHYTNILRMLGGPITHVAATAARTRDDWYGEDSAALALRFASGIIGEGFYCWATRTPAIGVEAYVYGERGSLEVNSQAPALVLHRDDLPGERHVVIETADYMVAFARIIDDFARAARGERAPTMPGSEGLEDLKVVMAAYRSIASGRLEPVDAPDQG
ncbi:MAG: Gfo/Idh/MocA family oxidoreductase [Chloroflexi bacterium]|nr:Gfo/Idh/MocA family oxidoreductase [Chloroflexota bacterium]